MVAVQGKGAVKRKTDMCYNQSASNWLIRCFCLDSKKPFYRIDQLGAFCFIDKAEVL